MSEPERVRLTTIVGIDVAGYSARTESDSAAAAREILALRERIAALTARHSGRVFNTAGDGVMMEFTSARDAVAAIFEILDEAAAKGPPLHVGAHLGDVTESPSGDLLGHGVNVTARLLALAQPGHALISQELKAAMAPVEHRAMRALGEVTLPKMQSKVSAFEISAAISSGAAPSSRRQAHEVSIAVLPFVNMSPDSDQEYFSDGLSEELINQLAQISALRVAGRTSSFALKGKNEDFSVIADRLRVSHVLEGSVRKAGQHLRITAQLIDCSNGFHL